jgi:L-alanine-DL-glutamate epimerase-like enolase superfamily enzyme
MRANLRLLAADLHYPAELALYTAASGRISTLSERYLQIERSDGFSGAGEVRANINYLSRIPESAVNQAIRQVCTQLPWTAPPEDILSTLHRLSGQVPLACAAVENALLDAMARHRGISVAALLGGSWQPSIETNQCLFWSSDETFDRLAARYVAEGFRQLKVRVAIAGFDADLSRLRRLRERVPASVSIAIDANGAWSQDEAVERIKQLRFLNLSYVEQPTAPGDWTAVEKVIRSSPIPIMIDEGLQTSEDIDRLAKIGPPTLAHLKIVKLGGVSNVINASRRLANAGVGVMIGQMNEGGAATALTVQCAMALQPRFAELYGCYGLIDDVTSEVRYANGAVSVPSDPGIGVRPDLAKCHQIWTEWLT